MGASASNPFWNWRAEGFLQPPSLVTTSRRLALFRVWGGTASEMGSPSRPGVCMSFHQPKSRREAEGLYSVFEWGNTCRFVTPFLLLPGARLYVGKAHPGDFYNAGLGNPGSQVFVETGDDARVRAQGWTSSGLDR